MDNFANMPAYLMILRSPTRLYPRTRCPVARHFGWKLTKSRISSRRAGDEARHPSSSCGSPTSSAAGADLFMADQTASRSGSSPKLRWRVRQPGLQTKRNFHRLRGSPPLKAGRFNMPSTSRFGIGLLFIAGAIGLHFLSFVFQYVGYLLRASVPAGQESFYLGLHTLWIPLSGPLLVGATAAVLIVGFLIVWRDRAYLEPSQRAFMGLAGLGFAASVVGALIRTSLGVVLGFVYAPGLRGALGAVDMGFAIALGLTFYWLLLGVGVWQARTAGVVALVIGSVSSGPTVLWRATPSDGVAVIGLTAGVVFLPPPLPPLFLVCRKTSLPRAAPRPGG